MNKNSQVFFSKTQIKELVRTHQTPFHFYEERGIREAARSLNDAFSWASGFMNYYAVKANPNPHILKILGQEGCGADCSSGPELALAQMAGIKGEKVMFTSNNTPAAEFKRAFDAGAVINLDDITHIPFLMEHAGVPDLICFRYNPGPLIKTRAGNVIGNPVKAKYGLTNPQLIDAYRIMKHAGTKRFGLHTMVASNSLDPYSFVETASALFDAVLEISQKVGISFEFVNIGGGIGIPYRPEHVAVDLGIVSAGIQSAYEEKIVKNGLAPLKIFMENGRLLTGPYGYLVTTAIHKKHIYEEYVGVDASAIADLPRPAIYGAYHHITVLGKEDAPEDHVYNVVDSLCENNGRFTAEPRALPYIEIGDELAIHNDGAHTRPMGSNYNGKLRSPELLLRLNGNVEMIRRRETEADYFATLNYPGSEFARL
jgi:diaminopimelate decarboxylase